MSCFQLTGLFCVGSKYGASLGSVDQMSDLMPRAPLQMVINCAAGPGVGLRDFLLQAVEGPPWVQLVPAAQGLEGVPD